MYYCNANKSKFRLIEFSKVNTTKSRNARIFGAKEAKFQEFPWQILLSINYNIKDIMDGEVKKKKKKCGGALLSEQHILTAASCFYDDDDLPPS